MRVSSIAVHRDQLHSSSLRFTAGAPTVAPSCGLPCGQIVQDAESVTKDIYKEFIRTEIGAFPEIVGPIRPRNCTSSEKNSRALVYVCMQAGRQG
jgi:hypothetical protein